MTCLKHGDGAVQPHAGIDIFVFKRRDGSVRRLVILHENVVPYLKVLAAATTWVTIIATSRLACVYKHLSIRTARAFLAGWSPPVVFFRQIEYVRSITPWLIQ